MIVKGFFVNTKTGQSMHFHGIPEEMQWILPEGLYLMSMDQSSTCTGVYITNSKQTFRLVLDIYRQDRPLHLYMKAIESIIKSILRKAEVTLFVREQPLPKGGYSSAVLHTLIGYINNWMDQYTGIPALRNIPDDLYGNILPQVWRKHIVDKSLSKNRSSEKHLIAYDIVNLFPELEPYYKKFRLSESFDGFEAVGILHGYIMEHQIVFDGEGNSSSTVIAGSVTYHGKVSLYYRFYNQESTDSLDFVGYFKELFEGYNFQTYSPNPDRLLYENTRLCASDREFSALLYNDPEVILPLLMQYGIKDISDSMIVYVIRDSILPTRLKKVLDSQYKGELQSW